MSEIKLDSNVDPISRKCVSDLAEIFDGLSLVFGRACTKDVYAALCKGKPVGHRMKAYIRLLQPLFNYAVADHETFIYAGTVHSELENALRRNTEQIALRIPLLLSAKAHQQVPKQMLYEQANALLDLTSDFIDRLSRYVFMDYDTNGMSVLAVGSMSASYRSLLNFHLASGHSCTSNELYHLSYMGVALAAICMMIYGKLVCYGDLQLFPHSGFYPGYLTDAAVKFLSVYLEGI